MTPLSSSFFTNFRLSNIINLLFRTLQLIDGLVVIGMYGVDLNRARKEDKYSDSKWVHLSHNSTAPEVVRLIFTLQVYAVTLGCLAAATAIAYALISVFWHYRTLRFLFVWEGAIVVLWAALAGIFGSMYMNEKIEMDEGVHRMKVAVGFDLAGLCLWFITAAMGTLWFCRERWGGKVPGRQGKA